MPRTYRVLTLHRVGRIFPSSSALRSPPINHHHCQMRHAYLVMSLLGANLRVKYFWPSDPNIKNIPGKRCKGGANARGLRSQLEHPAGNRGSC